MTDAHILRAWSLRRVLQDPATQLIAFLPNSVCITAQHVPRFVLLRHRMVHGLLADEGNEFFIRPRELRDPMKQPSQQPAGDDTRQPDAKQAGSTAALASSKHLLNRTEAETYHDWHEAFEVRGEVRRLPDRPAS